MIIHPTVATSKARHTGWSGAARVVTRLGLALAIFLAGDLLIYRPLQLRWGATAAEVVRAMPGDTIEPHPIFNATRAVTIAARPNQIWPWLVQIGEGRAGWYGYDVFDNDGVPSSDHILPQWQHVRVGDNLPISSIAHQTLVAFEPNSYLLWEGGDHSTYLLALYPVDATHTRLIWRMRAAPYVWTDPYIVPQLFADTVDVIAVRQNLLGITARVEGAPLPDPALMYIELALWLAAFFGFVGAEVELAVRRDWLRPLLATPLTGFITIGLILARPPLWLDGLAVLGMYVGLWRLYHSTGQGAAAGERRPILSHGRKPGTALQGR